MEVIILVWVEHGFIKNVPEFGSVYNYFAFGLVLKE